MKKLFFTLLFITCLSSSFAQQAVSPFSVRGFHLDLRIQVMTMPALKNFALS